MRDGDSGSPIFAILGDPLSETEVELNGTVWGGYLSAERNQLCAISFWAATSNSLSSDVGQVTSQEGIEIDATFLTGDQYDEEERAINRLQLSVITAPFSVD